MGENARRPARRNGARTRNAAEFIAEGLERRLLLSSAITASGLQQTFASGSQPRALAVADPSVISINRATPAGTITAATTVSYAVTFSEAVTGVDPSDFALALSGVSAVTPVAVSGSGSAYTVTVSGITGNGTLGLNLVDNGSIRDLAGNPLQTDPMSFAPQEIVATGNGPYSVTTADVNGDGKPDLIAANLFAGSISVLLGNGDGTFQPQKTFGLTPGSYPGSVAAFDVNGDGKLDLVTANRNSNNVSVLLGNGNGTFQAQKMFPAGHGADFVTVADLNADGKPDLVVANNGDDDVSVLLGNGNGTFQAQQTFAAGSEPISLALADVNGDGIADLVVSGGQRTDVSLLLGNGNGTFQALQTVATGTVVEFHRVALADLNADGKADLIVSNMSENSVSTMLGNGNGTFQAAQTFAVGLLPQFMAVSDINGDGKPDVIVANAYSYSVSVLPGNGDGTFQTQQSFATGSEPETIAVADFNGDGRPDIATGNLGFTTASVLLNNGTGNFNGETYTIVPSLDTITGTSGIDQITLIQDPDHTHIDWTLKGTTIAQMSITNPNGLTINGNGSNDVVTLDYTNGSPLPNTLHLNGTFTINNLQGTNPLAGTTLEIGKSTVFISYSSSDPIAAIQSYLQAGYNSGAWNGSPTASTGVITSAAAQANANHNTAIGYADAADGLGVNTTANTIELKYTLIGDANLSGNVNSADLQAVLSRFNNLGPWDQGDFNYSGNVNSADLQALLSTFNTSLGNQATPLAVGATATATTPLGTGGLGGDPSRQSVLTVHSTGSTAKAIGHPHPAKKRLPRRR